MSEPQKVRSHWPVSVLSTLSSLVNMMLPLVLVRVLKPDEIGVFKVFFLYMSVLPGFSFMTGVLSGLPYWSSRKAEESGPEAVRMSSMLMAASAVFLFVISWTARPWIASFLGWELLYVEVLCAGLLATLASSFYEEIAIAHGRIWTGALFASGTDLIRTCAILVTALWTRSLLAIFIAYGLIFGLKTVVGYSLGLREGWAGFQWDPKVFKAVWRYALPVSVAWGFGMLVNYSDQVILSKYLSPTEFAFYSIGCLTVPPLYILEMSVTRVLIPQIAAAFSAGDSTRAAMLYRRAVADLSYLTIPSVAGMIVFAEPIIQLLFTSRYASAAGYMRVYSLFYLSLAVPHDSVARARGHARWIMGSFISFSLFTLALCFALTLVWGAWGALIGLVSARAVMRAYSVFYVRRTESWRFAEFLPLDSAARSAVVCAVLGATCWVLSPLFGGPTLGWFLVCGPMFSIAYFALTVAWSRAVAPVSDGRPKVLMLTQHLGIGGLERMILNLSGSLSGWEPSVFVYDHQPDAPSGRSNLIAEFGGRGIPVEAFSKGKGFSFRAVVRIARLALDRDISVIHTHDLGALIYGVCAKLATMGKVRLVHTQHSFVHMKRLRRYALYERVFTYFADELAVVSPDTRAGYVALGLAAERIHVIPNGVAFAEPATAERKAWARRELVAQVPALAGLEDAEWLLYMARIHGRKGQDHALKLWEALPASQRSRSTLIYVGPETQAGQLAALEQGIAQAPDRARIVIAGPAERPATWLEASDVYLSCSEFEGMPLGPVEGAGAGLPLVLSRIAGHSEFTADFYDLTEPAQGARAVAVALSKRGKLQGVAQAARARYSLETMALAYERLYGATRPARRLRLMVVQPETTG